MKKELEQGESNQTKITLKEDKQQQVADVVLSKNTQKRLRYSPKKLLNDAFNEHIALNRLMVNQAQSAAIIASQATTVGELTELFEAQAKALGSVAVLSSSTEKKLRFATEQLQKTQKQNLTKKAEQMSVRVRGTIVYKNGMPVAGAKVVFVGATSKTQQTDADGCYDFLNAVAKDGEFCVKVCTKNNAIMHTVQHATLREYVVNLILP